MILPRVLEPEVMDSPEEAADYDAMDHAHVNRVFVDDLLTAVPAPTEILDLGTGTARIPLEICQRVESVRIMAADAAVAMLELARFHIEAAGYANQIQLAHVDAKSLPFPDGMFPLVISNSILHHIPDPGVVLREAVRVTAADGQLFFRDLMRPDSETAVQHLVTTYAAGATDAQRNLFEASLRAALRLDEIRDLVAELGFSPESVCQTSDRHWTWIAQRNTSRSGTPRAAEHLG
ncbi:MAG: class I SAM-dependent methyltransferase [Pirellulaceae bacterium]